MFAVRVTVIYRSVGLSRVALKFPTMDVNDCVKDATCVVVSEHELAAMTELKLARQEKAAEKYSNCEELSMTALLDDILCEKWVVDILTVCACVGACHQII